MAVLKNIFEKIINLFKDENKIKFFKHFVLVVFFIFLIFIGGPMYLIRQADKQADDWLKNEIKLFQNEKQIEFADNPKFENEIEKKRLQFQYTIIRNKALLHLQVIKYYYPRFYMSIVMTSICGLIAGVSLLFISKSGWSNANSYVIMLFVIFLCSTIFYGAFPSLFKHKENIEQNKKLYTLYADLENKVLSYSATGSDSTGNEIFLSSFIHSLDQNLEKINSLPIELDPKAILDMNNVIKELKKADQ